MQNNDSQLANVPLMTHHTFSTVPLTQCPGSDDSVRRILLKTMDVY